MFTPIKSSYRQNKFPKTVACCDTSSSNINMQITTCDHRIRQFCPPRDHAHLIEICNDVYGGTDSLPQSITSKSMQPHSHIFALTDRTDTLQSIICSEIRGSMLWIYGLRTRPDQRGQGHAQRLLAYVERFAATELRGRVDVLMSTTITANEIMMRLFQKHGYSIQTEILGFPSWKTWHALHKVDNEKRKKEQPDDDDSSSNNNYRPHSLIEAMPPLKHLLDDQEIFLLSQKWIPCTSIDQAKSIVMMLRAALVDTNSNVDHDMWCWVPGEYEVYPLDSIVIQNMLHLDSCNDKGKEPLLHLWILSSNTDHNNKTCGVAVVMHSEIEGRWISGIIASSELVVESALVFLHWHMPSCHKVYIDLRDGSNGGGVDRLKGLIGEFHDYILFHKMLD